LLTVNLVGKANLPILKNGKFNLLYQFAKGALVNNGIIIRVLDEPMTPL
jgi:hypothetical protein